MAIYDKDGNTVNAVYALSGGSLQNAYTIDGTPIYEEEPIEYGIENVISYFQDDTLAVASEINSLSSDWQSFTFVTDTHTSNKYHSQAIVMYLLANTPTDKALFGGDYVASWNESDYKKYFNPFIQNGFTSMVYPTIGNHELFLYNGKTWDDLNVIYTDFLASKTKLHGSPQEFYYYFDKTKKKTRYLFINTSDHTGNDVSQTQISWIYDAVTLPSSDWSLVVIGHIDIDSTNITGQWKSSKASAVTSALLSCNGHIVGYFCGHEHIDQLRLVQNGFYQLICLCDVFENDNYFNVDNYPTRVSGTNTEQAVTVVSFNTKTGQVVTRRIGAGDEYTWNYLTLTT